MDIRMLRSEAADGSQERMIGRRMSRSALALVMTLAQVLGPLALVATLTQVLSPPPLAAVTGGFYTQSDAPTLGNVALFDSEASGLWPCQSDAARRNLAEVGTFTRSLSEGSGTSHAVAGACQLISSSAAGTHYYGWAYPQIGGGVADFNGSASGTGDPRHPSICNTPYPISMGAGKVRLVGTLDKPPTGLGFDATITLKATTGKGCTNSTTLASYSVAYIAGTKNAATRTFDLTFDVPVGTRALAVRIAGGETRCTTAGGNCGVYVPSFRMYASMGANAPPPRLPEELIADEQLLGNCQADHGNCPNHLESDPVNTATGNYVTQVTDLALPGRGLGMAFTRTYNSLDPTASVLGPGWTHPYAARLDLDEPDGAIRFVAEDGAQIVYRADGAGGYVAPVGVFGSLTELAGGEFELTTRDQLTYTFNPGGVLVALADRNGNALAFGYTAGLLTTITDTVGRTVSLTYNANGRIETLSGPPSRTVSYTYDASGRLATVTDARGKLWTYTYTAAGQLETVTDPNDHVVVTNEYGLDGRISAQTDARGKRGTFAWNPGTETSTYTDARGKAWIDDYASNALQSSTDPLGNTTAFAYDADFNPTAITDPRGNTTTLTYDANGNLTSRTAPTPLSYAESWTYTARNDVATYLDGRSNTTAYEYDPAGNLIRITEPLSAVTEFGRDLAGTGLLVSLTDPRAKTTTFGYDAQANLTSVTSSLGNLTTMTYDAAGRLLTAVDPRGNVAGADPAQYTTTFTYDAADHLLTAADPLGNVTTQAWDPAGNLASVTDPNTHATTYGYDNANHLTSVTDAASGVTGYAYDDVGNLTGRTDANFHVTSYAYDDASRLVSTTGPLSHVWTLTYDAAGNLATRTDANAKTTTYAYDALNRPTSVTYADPSTPAVTFGYDANNNGTSMIDGAGTESASFDALNRLTAVTRGSDTFSYGYDPAGNPTSRTYPGQTAQTLTYDDDGRLVTANGATYTYDPAANVLTVATPDGLTARYAHDRSGRLVEVAHTSAADTLSRFTYALDPAGNRTAMTTREGTVTYRYDVLDRLTEACWSPTTCPGGAPATPLACLACVGGLATRPVATVSPPPGETYRTYTHDPVGNRLSEASNAGTTAYAYDIADRLTSVTPPGQSAVSYTFDNNGNQTAAGADTFTWDLADRLKAANVGGVTESYASAGDGRRLSAASSGGTTQYVWDQSFGLPQLALERDGSGTLLRSYTYGLDLLSQNVGSSTYWYHHDGLGSVTDVSSNTGASLEWREYYPFGLLRQAGLVTGGSGAPAVQPFRFTGEQLDALTGLYHLRARQYDPGTGRFLTTDPVAMPISDPYVASYVYVRDNPVRDVDPSGMVPESSGGLIAFSLLDNCAMAPGVPIACARRAGSGGGPPGGGGGGVPPANLKVVRPGQLPQIEAIAGQSIHQLKIDLVGRPGIAKFDLYVARNGNVYLLRKGGIGEPMFTGVNIRTGTMR